MRFLGSVRWRIFLIAWLVYSAHFATNVVREHYPAFALAEHGTLRLDEYQGFHSDIFVHTDGHSYINNQVFVSVLAAVPLFVFDPVLDALEAHSKRQLAASGGDVGADYRTDKPMRVAFFRLVKERGLDLRFGAATAITVAFFMAPITALFLVYFYGVLRARGLMSGQAAGLTFLLGFGTPIFFRTTGLNHNMFVMYFSFLSFVCLWGPSRNSAPASVRDRLLAGLFGGLTITTDFIGVVILPVLYGYLLVTRARTTGWATSVRESLVMVAGSLPAIAVLMFTQWIMFGDPFLPAQHWMPLQNEFVSRGMRGVSLPDWDLALQNLFHPGFGIYVWGPLLALALIPVRPSRRVVLSTDGRWLVVSMFAAILLFCSANQYARLQWNSGFRYLVPLVPLLMLALADHWIRWPAKVQWAIAGLAVLHAWVLTVFREPVPQSWRLFLTEGPQLPWFRVLGMTASPDSAVLGHWWPPAIMLSLLLAATIAIWTVGERAAASGR